MRRIQAPLGERVPAFSYKIVRVVPILLAGCVGYLLGSAHIEAFRVADLSAAEAVALRFPQDVRNASLTTAVTLRSTVMKLHTQGFTSVADGSAPMRDAQRALLQPMPTLTAADQDIAEPARVQMASAEDADTSAATALKAVAQTASRSPALSPALSAPVAAPQASAVPAPKVAAVAPHRPAVEQRPGYVLNDAQIASIKERLHLTPGQEQMWPAVEAALRNIAYTHVQQPRGRSVPAAGATQTAAVDPEAVQGLKSAAVPLIMSFNDEQKEEVRNLVHVMGLDQLASQF